LPQAALMKKDENGREGSALMMIDADCHISPTLEGGNSITIDELIRRMDRSRVDKAVTWLQPPYVREVDRANEYVYKAAQQHPDRILGFGWADPNLGVQKAKEAVKKCIDDYGFFGVKLNGAQNEYYIDDPVLSIPLIEEIAKAGKILAFHVGADAYERTHPFRVAKVAKRYPRLQILMVHMGWCRLCRFEQCSHRDCSGTCQSDPHRQCHPIHSYFKGDQNSWSFAGLFWKRHPFRVNACGGGQISSFAGWGSHPRRKRIGDGR
jgi:hypothetical protein